MSAGPPSSKYGYLRTLTRRVTTDSDPAFLERVRPPKLPGQGRSPDRAGEGDIGPDNGQKVLWRFATVFVIIRF